MRTTLITSALAASVLTIGFATVAGASESGGHQAATPTTVPFNLDGLGLTPEQLDCLMGSATNVDVQDMTAIMELMTQCGINPMDLVTGATVPGVPTTVLSVVPTVPGVTVGPDAASVLATLGFDPATAQCIESGLLAAVSPGDDNEALTILQSCGLSLNELLTGLIALNASAGGTNPAVPTLPAVPTTASGATSPLVQQLIDTIQQQYGIELTPDQASCLLDNISTVDTEDVNAMLGLMEQCGISLTDLATG